MDNLRLQDLSKRGQDALWRAAGGSVTREKLETLSRHDVLIIKNCGTKTANEIVQWAARHGITMPYTNIKDWNPT